MKRLIKKIKTFFENTKIMWTVYPKNHCDYCKLIGGGTILHTNQSFQDKINEFRKRKKEN